jgi:hypothetical protein
MDCIALTNAEVCRSFFVCRGWWSQERTISAHRATGRAPLTRCSMKRGVGFVDSPSWRRARIENVGQCPWVDPVGGAPSRSGFLATPINASSWQTFSTEDTASREKRCRVGRLVRVFRKVRERITKSRRDPRGDWKKKSVQSPMQEPAKAS